MGTPYHELCPVLHNLRFWRQYRNLSQTALGKQTGILQTTISHIENGRWASLEQVNLLTTALSVKLDMLTNPLSITAGATVTTPDPSRSDRQ